MELKKLVLNELLLNRTLNEMCKNLQISKNEAYYYIKLLEDYGYYTVPRYYRNGDIRYQLEIEEYTKHYPKEITIDQGKKQSILRYGVCADFHIRKGDSMKRLEIMADICESEGAHYILVCGDNVDGKNSFRTGPFDMQADLDYLVKKLPQRKNIIYIFIIANHDRDLWSENRKRDVSHYLNRKRHDIVCLGYDYGLVDFDPFTVIMEHPSIPKDRVPIPLKDLNKRHDAPSIVYHGHTHRYKYTVNDEYIDVNVPTMSNILFSGFQPGFLITDVNHIISTTNYIFSADSNELYFGGINETPYPRVRKKGEEKEDKD